MKGGAAVPDRTATLAGKRSLLGVRSRLSVLDSFPRCQTLKDAPFKTSEGC
ncbi:MAG: hypothetical protein LBK25_09420 [Treponema sp.]|nr:hypothetical protein [Treponema sp.]